MALILAGNEDCFSTIICCLVGTMEVGKKSKGRCDKINVFVEDGGVDQCEGAVY